MPRCDWLEMSHERMIDNVSHSLVCFLKSIATLPRFVLSALEKINQEKQ